MFRFSLLGVVAAFSDETSLMQGLKPAQDVKKTHDKHAVANLLESAKGMLKNGETADVVTFAQETLDEIMNTVLPLIQDAHDVEQGILTAHFAAFEAAVVQLAQGVGEIHELHSDRYDRTNHHLTCRETEAQKCELKQYCDYNLYFLWKSFINEESDLRHIENDIYHRNTGHFCAEDAHGNFIMNGTTHEFRVASVPIMNEFTRQWPEVIAAVEAYGDLRPQCEDKFTVLDEWTAQCDAQQAVLEDVACQHRVRVQEVKNTFDCDWASAMYTYDLTEKESRLMQIDRIREFRALTTVQCLLDRTTERNGRPCDEHTDEITVEISHCEEVRRNVDTSRFELEFPCEERECGGIDSPSGIGPHLHTDGSTLPGCDGPLMCPEVLPQCAENINGVLKLEHSNYQGGRCRPLLPEHPCTAGEIFPGLPDVPQPDFHAQTVLEPQDQWKPTGNSHCNQREPCQLCELPETAECPVPERVWSWYTTQSVRLPAPDPVTTFVGEITHGHGYAQNEPLTVVITGDLAEVSFTWHHVANGQQDVPFHQQMDVAIEGNTVTFSSSSYYGRFQGTVDTAGDLTGHWYNLGGTAVGTFSLADFQTATHCTCEVTDSVGHLPSTNLGTQGALVVTNTMNEWVNTRGGISSLIVTKLTGSGHCALTVATGALGAGASSHIYGEGEHHYPMPTGNDNIHSFNLQCHAHAED